VPNSSGETVTPSLRTSESARDAAATSLMTTVSVNSIFSAEGHTPAASAASETSADEAGELVMRCLARQAVRNRARFGGVADRHDDTVVAGERPHIKPGTERGV